MVELHREGSGLQSLQRACFYELNKYHLVSAIRVTDHLTGQTRMEGSVQSAFWKLSDNFLATFWQPSGNFVAAFW